MKNILILDTVAITNPVTKERLTLVEPEYESIESLPNGQVGTVVEVYEQDGEKQYLVEFSDSQGREYAMTILPANELLVLHYELEVA
jgi:ribosomal protein S4E